MLRLEIVAKLREMEKLFDQADRTDYPEDREFFVDKAKVKLILLLEEIGDQNANSR